MASKSTETTTMSAGVLAVMQASARTAEKALLQAAGVEEGEMVPPDVADAITDIYKADEVARATVAELIEAAQEMMRQDAVQRATEITNPFMAGAADKLASALRRAGAR